jgi:hypothetical protein
VAAYDVRSEVSIEMMNIHEDTREEKSFDSQLNLLARVMLQRFFFFHDDEQRPTQRRHSITSRDGNGA